MRSAGGGSCSSEKRDGRLMVMGEGMWGDKRRFEIAVSVLLCTLSIHVSFLIVTTP